METEKIHTNRDPRLKKTALLLLMANTGTTPLSGKTIFRKQDNKGAMQLIDGSLLVPEISEFEREVALVLLEHMYK